MKSFILICCSVCMIISAIAQKARLETTAQEMNLKGKVKSIKEKVFSATEISVGEVAKDPKPNRSVEFEFDNLGNRIKYITYNSNSKIESTQTNKYGKPGQLLESNLLSETGKIVTKMIYEYNANDYIIKSTEYDGSGKIKEQYKFDYNFKDSYNYTFTKKNISGSIVYESAVVLSKTNNKPEATVDRTDQRNYTYDASGRVISISTQKGQTATYLFSNVYDKNGNCTEEKTKDFKKYEEIMDDVVTHKYTYDAKGNWVKQVQTVYTADNADNIRKSISVFERIIQYF